jgi:hypothetical protein
VTVGAADGDTVFKVVGPGVAAVGAPTAGNVFTGVGLTVGLTAGPVPAAVAEGVADAVAEATAAEAKALAAAESGGAEEATSGDEIAALGNPLPKALDAAATAGPDDAALLLCDELEHPESASAATTVTPINPVRRTRTFMAFPPAGMSPTIDDDVGRGVAFAELRQVPPDLSTASVTGSVLLSHLARFSLGHSANQSVSKLRLVP